MKIKTEAGFLTKAGWGEAIRMGNLTLTEEQRMIGLLLNEIKRRNIILETCSMKINERGDKDAISNLLKPTE